MSDAVVLPREEPVVVQRVAGDRVATWSRRAFLWSFALVALLGITLAAVNNLPGHWDAINNLATARNIVEGRGFVSDVVQQLAAPEALPGPETVRPPGVPYLMAAIFSVFGVSYAAPVLVNVLAVLLTALIVRQAVRETGGRWEADLAAALVLLSHATYELRSIWNNDLLTLLTALMLLVAVRHLAGRLTGWRFVLACATLTAVGFLTKQTFMLGAIPLAVGLLVTDVRRPLATRLLQGAAFLALFALLSSPYWFSNLERFGQALYSPIQGLRLPTRYGLLPTDRFHRTVRYGAPGFSYATIVAAIGVKELLAREVAHWGRLLAAIVLQNPVVVLVAAIGLAFARRADWRLYCALVALLIPPVFDSSYWIMEKRYLFSVFPISLFLAWLGVRGWRESARARPASSGRERHRRLAGPVLAVAALLWAALPAARQWRWELIAARFAGPTWVAAVEALPRGATLMAAYPPEVNWYTRRRVVIAPVGTHGDLVQVLERYRPAYFLDMEPEVASRHVPFAGGELARVSQGDGWRLYRIAGPLGS